MPSPVILTRTNVAFSRPDYNNLQIDPQAPEAQGLYISASVPLGRPVGTNTWARADSSTYRWPVAYTVALGTQADPTVGSFAVANGTATRYQVTLNPPPPSTSQATMAVWVRRRGALVAASQFCSLASGIGMVIGTDATTPALLIWGNAPITTITGLILPLDEWSLVVGTHKDAFSTIYLFSNGINASFGPYADSNVTRVISTLVAGSITQPNMAADYAELAFWARAFTPNEVRALYDPQTRWRRYYVPKTYWQFGDTPVADTQPFAAQPPRPKYIGLNAFSPQAQGLLDWLPAVDGALVQAQTRTNGTTEFGFTSDVPNTVVQRVTSSQARGPKNLVSPSIQPSDLGMVARSTKEAASVSNRTVLYYTPFLSLTGLTNLTCVYWIYPLPSAYTDASYWGTSPDNDNTSMTNSLLTFQLTQSFVLPSDPHLVGRWQMITVARTLAGVNIWRDQTLVFTGASTGTALSQPNAPLFFQVGGVETTSDVNGVNALWADFRIYNREWKQPDVDYAYNVKTRWDYYADTSIKPWELPLTPTPPVVTFLSRLALMGAG